MVQDDSCLHSSQKERKNVWSESKDVNLYLRDQQNNVDLLS